jgi:hypothetical protein
MKKTVLMLLCLVSFLGCCREDRMFSSVPDADSRHLLSAVSTNPTVKTVMETRRIRERLNMVEDDAARRGALQTWRKTLMSLDLMSLPVLDRACVVREIGHCLLWDAVGARCDMGASYADRWNDYFESLAWIDGQVAALKPGSSGGSLPQDRASRRKLLEKWDAYLVVVEFRESVIENLEINGFDERVFPQDIEDMKPIRDRFERIIGRRVRARKEITRLGTFAKEARRRVLKEIDGYLKGERSSAGEIDCSDGIDNLQEE